MPLPDQMKTHPVFHAVTSFLEKKSLIKAPVESGVVEEEKIYDAIYRVERRLAHEEMLKEVKRKKQEAKTEQREAKKKLEKKEKKNTKTKEREATAAKKIRRRRTASEQRMG